MKVYIVEAVDPEDRKVRLYRIKKYMQRNMGALKMTSNADPHAQAHYLSRANHAGRMLAVYKTDLKPKYRRMFVNPQREERRELRRAQAKAQKISKRTGQAIVPHAAMKLTNTMAWRSLRRHKGLNP